ncbi:glycosyltransferase [Candidatus Shapirobacteria bacterium]|nr:glycosyltransferase [Candidatus Shapirobacteria bacterium]
MLKRKKPLLSVIVPAYKQEKTIAKDLQQIENVLKQIRYDYEIICVVDGRVDKTYQNAKKTKSKKIRVVGYLQNRGKGYAVRYGMARARGNPIAFIDAGMEIDPNGLSMILEHMEWYNADIIIGSKRHPASQVNYPVRRRIISRLYQLFVKFFTGLNVSDTQAGLKIYRRKVLEAVLPRLIVKRYAFDLEMLVVAHHLGFGRIFEAPVKITYNFKDLTHASTLEGMKKALIDTLAIIYRLRFLRYYDDHNKRKWRYDPELDLRINVG